MTPDADALAEASTLGPQHRLATYGTLGPGRPNHHQLSTLMGRWSRGYVHGRLVAAGWGADLGFPAIVLGPDGPQVDVEVFESHELPDHWDRLDQFEGAGYARVVTTVHTVSGDVQASIYVLLAPVQISRGGTVAALASALPSKHGQHICHPCCRTTRTALG